ncbi:MAG: S-layer homology domain-containing protein [Firmicutes bacterium]|nr:S-layer homology domain-containing protein [Bacillota bacterium]
MKSLLKLVFISVLGLTLIFGCCFGVNADENNAVEYVAGVTRAEFLKMVSEAMGSPEIAPQDTSFSDVSLNHNLSGYVAFAADKGIVNGYGQGLFGPNDLLTFEQAVKIIVMACKQDKALETSENFPVGYVAVARQNNLLAGIADAAWDNWNSPISEESAVQLAANSLPIMLGEVAFEGAVDMLKDKTLELVYEDNFETNKNNFKLEGMGGYDVKDGVLHFSDPVLPGSGTTLWVDEEFSGNLYISYNCKAVNVDDAKNLNLFFYATTLDGKDVLSEEHSGFYGEYHKTVNSYILTFTYGHSRVRKDPGFIILSEDMNKTTSFETEYFIECIKIDNHLQIKIDGEVIHDIVDSEPYEYGKIGFRTYHSDTIFDNFKVYQIK